MRAPGFMTPLLACVLMITAGCGTFYSETRDKQGQAAKEARPGKVRSDRTEREGERQGGGATTQGKTS